MSLKLRTVITVDPSGGTSDRSDWFVVSVVSQDLYTGLLHVRYIFRDRIPPEDQADKLWTIYKQYNPLVAGIEDIFLQSQLVRKARRMGMRVFPIKRSGKGTKDKAGRLLNLAMRYADRTIIHPRDRNGNSPPWLESYETELATIGWQGGVQIHVHDDQADTINDACDLLTGDVLPRGDVAPIHHPVTVDPGRNKGQRKSRWKEKHHQRKVDAIDAAYDASAG